MKRQALLLLGTLLLVPQMTQAATVFTQPHNGTGTVHKSSWYSPDGLDGDVYCWDAFMVASSAAISVVHWRGAYEYHPSGAGQSPVYDFEVSIYRSISGGSQPDMGPGGRLVRYLVGGNAGEISAGSFAGVQMYDYAFSLPSPFQAVGGTPYWVQIEAYQGLAAPSYAPDWGLAVGTGGNNSHFRKTTGANFQFISNDLAFSLEANDGPTVTISAIANPVVAGAVSGAGSYPVGSTASLFASASAGWGFVDWTENGTSVSTNPHYSFTVTVNRALVANFAPAWTISTASSPAYGGTTSGDGIFTEGSVVTVTAVPNPGFVFAGWSDGGATAVYSLTVTGDMILTAFFDSAPGCVTYDFDTAPGYTSLPLDLTINGLTAHFTGNYSVQQANTLGFTPAGFSGLCLYPGSVFQSDLVVSFSERVTYFSVLYSPCEIACDQSSLMRVTAYLNGIAAGTNTTRANPGTWPTATLSINVPTGFNSVVVHFDTPGWPCTDYAPIFMADIVTVTREATTSVPEAGPPDAVRLFAPFPNPFENSTSIDFTLPGDGLVTLNVYDVAGRLVRHLVRETLPAGSHSTTWNAADDAGRPVASGVYVMKLEAGRVSAHRRMVVSGR